jgi:hypothetical protein
MATVMPTCRQLPPPAAATGGWCEALSLPVPHGKRHKRLLRCSLFLQNHANHSTPHPALGRGPRGPARAPTKRRLLTWLGALSCRQHSTWKTYPSAWGCALLVPAVDVAEREDHTRLTRHIAHTRKPLESVPRGCCSNGCGTPPLRTNPCPTGGQEAGQQRRARLHPAQALQPTAGIIAAPGPRQDAECQPTSCCARPFAAPPCAARPLALQPLLQVPVITSSPTWPHFHPVPPPPMSDGKQ